MVVPSVGTRGVGSVAPGAGRSPVGSGRQRRGRLRPGRAPPLPAEAPLRRAVPGRTPCPPRRCLPALPPHPLLPSSPGKCRKTQNRRGGTVSGAARAIPPPEGGSCPEPGAPSRMQLLFPRSWRQGFPGRGSRENFRSQQLSVSADGLWAEPGGRCGWCSCPQELLKCTLNSWNGLCWQEPYRPSCSVPCHGQGHLPGVSVPEWWNGQDFLPEPSPGQDWGSHGKKPVSCISGAGSLHAWQHFQYCSLAFSITGHDVSPQSEVVFPGLLGLHTGCLTALLSLSPEWKSEERGMLPTVTGMWEQPSSSEVCDAQLVACALRWSLLLFCP